MLTVHHLGNSQSERIVWLCEELGVDYAMTRYDREPSMSAPPAYKALHPLGTAPIITDGDLTLAETGAIVEYIARRYAGGRLIPTPNQPNFPDYLFWFHYANGSLVPALMMDMVAKQLGSAPLSARSDKGFAMVEQRLGEVPWFAGDNFTLADIMMAFPLSRAPAFSGKDMSAYPNIQAYVKRASARPAWQRAMAKAEPGEVRVPTN